MVTDNTKSALRLYNQHLHTLSEDVTVKHSINILCILASWATTAKDEGVAISVISESLGYLQKDNSFTLLLVTTMR